MIVFAYMYKFDIRLDRITHKSKIWGACVTEHRQGSVGFQLKSGLLLGCNVERRSTVELPIRGLSFRKETELL